MPGDASIALRWAAMLSLVSAVGAASAGDAPTTGEAPTTRACDAELVPLERFEPAWPRRALVEGIEGQVKAEGTVGPDGRVVEVHVVFSEPPALFDKNALAAIKRWRFAPCVVDGVPVSRAFMQTINFHLDAGPTPPVPSRLVSKRRDVVAPMVIELAKLCPDVYPHADDEVNKALADALAKRRGGRAPPAPTPLPRDDLAAEFVLQSYAECLYTSWEQLADPIVHRVAAGYALLPTVASPAVRIGMCAQAPTGRPWSECEAARGSDAEALAEGVQARRRWLFSRLNEGYAGLITRQAATRVLESDMDIAVDAALRTSAAAFARQDAPAGYGALEAALAKAKVPSDRALLQLALGRAHFEHGRPIDAIPSLRSAAAAQAPWDVQQTARYLLVVIAIREADAALFDESLAALNAGLGTTDKLKF